MKPSSCRGFTLIELMVVIFVLGIALGLGVPSFNAFMANNRMAAATNDLIGSLQAARSEAIKRRRTVNVCPSTSRVSCDAGATFRDGWIVFVECPAPPGGAAVPPPCNPDGTVNGADVVVQVGGPMPASITNVNTSPAGRNFVSYGSDGFLQPRTNGAPTAIPGATIDQFLICDERAIDDIGGGTAAARLVELQPVGRPRVIRERATIIAELRAAGGCA